MRNADIGTYLVSRGSLRQSLVHLKVKFPPSSKSGVVYHAPRAGKLDQQCNVKYIGKTERSMEVRFRELHNRAKLRNSDSYSSAIDHHAKETGHQFRPSDISFLDTDINKIARGIKEAIYTRALDLSLNRGGGLCYDLPPSYDKVIHDAIRPPPP
jgi:hypothetical protein